MTTSTWLWQTVFRNLRPLTAFPMRHESSADRSQFRYILQQFRLRFLVFLTRFEYENESLENLLTSNQSVNRLKVEIQPKI